MKLKDYNFEKTEGIFSNLKTDSFLLEIAKEKGFYNGHTSYNNLFSELFFSGGKLNFKTNLDPEFKTNATVYLKSFMSSFEPKHEEKEAICSLLLSELVDI